ncbi:MAG: adenylyltransferase/cytidyltransferase family protein, partial [Gallicola sp.]|nr:adenylyltransferase/cytidyltransferase family protein [Gallicola sp.]
MNKKYDLMVFIGRFQPLHDGHVKIIERAHELSDNVMIGIGSTNQSRSTKNPFTFEERSEMIKTMFPDVVTVALADYRYDDQKWLANARGWFGAHIQSLEATKGIKINPSRIALIGHKKDGSSFYLKMFPEWKHESVENFMGINATDIREGYFESGDILVDHVPYEVIDLIQNKFEKNLINVFEDYKMIRKYKESWKSAPYPPTFVTVDAVVVCSGHILLVERGASPGKGLTALPGGFINQNETLLT